MRLGGVHPARPGGRQDRHDRGLRRHAGRGRRQLRRRQPAVQRADRRPLRTTGGSSTSTCGRTTPRAPRRSATRSPSSSAGGCREQVVIPIASGSLLTKVDKALRELVALGLVEATPYTGLRRAGDRLLAGRPRPTRPATTSCGRCKPDTIAKSLAIGNPADGPYALDVARRTGGAIEDVSDDEVVEGIRLLAQHRGHLRRDRRRRDRRRAAQAARRRAARPGRPRR